MGGILPGYPAPSSERRSLRRLPADGLNLEAQWVLAAQAGYTLAFDELVARNQDRIYRLAANITRNPSDAQATRQIPPRNRTRSMRGDRKQADARRIAVLCGQSLRAVHSSRTRAARNRSHQRSQAYMSDYFLSM